MYIIPEDQFKNLRFRESMNLVFRTNICSRNQLSSLISGIIPLIGIALTSFQSHTYPPPLLPSRFCKSYTMWKGKALTPQSASISWIPLLPRGFSCSLHCVGRTESQVLSYLSHLCLSLGPYPPSLHSVAPRPMTQS